MSSSVATTTASRCGGVGLHLPTAADRLIVALDFDTVAAATALVDSIGPAVQLYKVGLEIFLSTGGVILEALHQRQKRVFLDLKFHDITTTVLRACAFAAAQHCFMFNVHCSCGEATLRAVADRFVKAPPLAAPTPATAAAPAPQEGGNGKDDMATTRPLVIGVTVLTNLGPQDLRMMLPSSANTDTTTNTDTNAEDTDGGALVAGVVHQMAATAHRAGLSGIVCSPHEAAAAKAAFGPAFVTVCPGVRPTSCSPSSSSSSAQQSAARSDKDDQNRIMTPGAALRAGADFLVVGRPITQAQDPKAAAAAILAEMNQALAEMAAAAALK